MLFINLSTHQSMARSGNFDTRSFTTPHSARSGSSSYKNNPKTDSRELRWVESMTKWMDSAFRIPGTNFRFGLDPIIGLFPIVGEVITFTISGAMILSMAKYGASRKVVMLMLGNLLIDSTVGAIPVIGDLFDASFKANQRNLRLLREHQLEGKHRGKGTGLLIAVAIILILMLALVVYGLWQLGEWLVSLF